jgi:DHA1 family tetracycline resistance protein-like MFS transporter
MDKRRLVTVFVIVFVDLLGFGLILPLLPFYADAYGATPFVVGLLAASYAAAQFIGAPVLGRLSDRYGRRPVLLISIAGTVVGFLLLGLAEPLGRALAGNAPAATANAIILAILFLSRILDGVTGGNISVAQAYITDVTDEENRARGLGLIGAAFGLGFIIGPALGGALSAGGRYAVPAFVAAAIAALNWLAVLFWLPESLTEESKAELAKQPARSIFSARELWNAPFRPPAECPLLVRPGLCHLYRGLCSVRPVPPRA